MNSDTEEKRCMFMNMGLKTFDFVYDYVLNITRYVHPYPSSIKLFLLRWDVTNQNILNLLFKVDLYLGYRTMVVAMPL